MSDPEWAIVFVPVAWRRSNDEWYCWDFTSEIPDDDPEGWEPLYAECRY